MTRVSLSLTPRGWPRQDLIYCNLWNQLQITSNYILRHMWDEITCGCPWYPLLAPRSSYILWNEYKNQSQNYPLDKYLRSTFISCQYRMSERISIGFKAVCLNDTPKYTIICPVSSICIISVAIAWEHTWPRVAWLCCVVNLSLLHIYIIPLNICRKLSSILFLTTGILCFAFQTRTKSDIDNQQYLISCPSIYRIWLFARTWIGTFLKILVFL